MPSLMGYVRDVFKKLDEKHFKILEVIEEKMSRYEVVPKEVIISSSGIGPRAEKLLRKLHEYRLIWAPLGIERGFCMNYNGLDLLALKFLVGRNVIESLGKPLGIGKEADVYDAMSPDGRRLAVKFFRIGRTSFKKYERHRTALISARSYIEASIKSAEQEYRALRMLYPRGVKVPKPIARNRHVIVTEFFQGIEIASAQYLTDPLRVLGDVLENVKKAYDVGVVHGDLSVYNVLITPEEEALIIDWPQWISSSHPMAKNHLKRDIESLVRFFRRRWKIGELPEEYLDIIKSLYGETFLTSRKGV
ncbi:MAG: serine/threonine protein kinase [Aigarchaeota archaeon]|nr:serine/threonine protein kinase [Aigarchaeota archaeon]